MSIHRIFYATDLHGSEVCFLKFVNAWRFYKANTLIMGGDVTGKMVIPVVKESDNFFRARLHGFKRTASSSQELEKLLKHIKDTGYYPYLTTPEEMEELKKGKEKVNKIFERLMRERLAEWLNILSEHLKNTSVKCYLTGGNDDPPDILRAIKNIDSENIVDPEDKLVWIDEHHEMMSLGYSNITPWKCPRDISEEEFASKIDMLATNVQNMKNCIFNIHCPPYDSQIDYAPELDEQLTPRIESGVLKTIPVGSKVVRNCIEKYQPLLGLHGHIHESSGFYKIGKTLCLNPGSEYSEGSLKGVIINLDKKGIKSYMFTRG